MVPSSPACREKATKDHVSGCTESVLDSACPGEDTFNTSLLEVSIHKNICSDTVLVPYEKMVGFPVVDVKYTHAVTVTELDPVGKLNVPTDTFDEPLNSATYSGSSPEHMPCRLASKEVPGPLGLKILQDPGGRRGLPLIPLNKPR